MRQQADELRSCVIISRVSEEPRPKKPSQKFKSPPQNPSFSAPPGRAAWLCPLASMGGFTASVCPQNGTAAGSLVPPAASCRASGDSRGSGAQLQPSSAVPSRQGVSPKTAPASPPHGGGTRGHPWMPRWVPRHGTAFFHHPILPPGKGPWVSPVPLPWRVPRIAAHLWDPFPACTVR